ncbi:MAG: hypothetical protein ACPGQV_16325 [Alphaproteobacteria bacterium]
MINAQRAEGEQSKEREAEDRRKATLQEKMYQRRAREDGAVAKAKEKAVPALGNATIGLVAISNTSGSRYLGDKTYL